MEDWRMKERPPVVPLEVNPRLPPRRRRRLIPPLQQASDRLPLLARRLRWVLRSVRVVSKGDCEDFQILVTMFLFCRMVGKDGGNESRSSVLP